MHSNDLKSPQMQSPNKNISDTPFFNKPQYQTGYESKINQMYSKNLQQCLDDENFYDSSRTFEHSCDSCYKFKEQISRLQETIQNVQNQVVQKQYLIKSLEKQNSQLKQQEQYLMKAIQQLRDKRKTDSTQADLKIQKIHKIKLQQLAYANKQIIKLKQWLKEQKAEAFRCLQCVKIKDQIIKNLQTQNQKLKQEARPKKRSRKIENGSQKLTEQDELVKFRRKAKQLQQQVYQLTHELDSMRNDNCNLKQQLSRIQSFNGNLNQMQIGSPILKLEQSVKIGSVSEITKDNSKITTFQKQKQTQKQKIRQRQKQKQKQNKIMKLLSKKCLQLETQIQKLYTKLQKLKNQNQNLRALKKKEYSFANLQRTEEILRQNMVYF